MKRPRRYEKDEKKGNHFGGSKAPKTPISIGEEYIVSIEEIGKQGVGIGRIRGVLILVDNTNPGDKVMVRITKLDAPLQWLKSLTISKLTLNYRCQGYYKMPRSV